MPVPIETGPPDIMLASAARDTVEDETQVEIIPQGLRFELFFATKKSKVGKAAHHIFKLVRPAGHFYQMASLTVELTFRPSPVPTPEFVN